MVSTSPARRAAGDPGEPRAAAGPQLPIHLDAAYFDAAVCRNCGAPLKTQYCGHCGQKKAARLEAGELRRETWQHWRLFEVGSARTLWRLITGPGDVAREYVMGRRKDHMHPLKLLLVLVALLVVLLNYGQWFSHFAYSTRDDAQVDRMVELVRTYANWSFTTGIFAIFAASWLVYRRRLGYNAMEHAVLAVYAQILVLAALVLNLLPTMIWNAPDFVSAYKEASKWYVYALKLLIVGLAFRQFFLVDLRHGWPRLAVALLVYAAASWLLLRLFAYAILKIAQYQLS